MAFVSIKGKQDAEAEKEQIEADIARLKEIETVVAELEASRALVLDVTTMVGTTYQLNENAREFITELENKIPTSVVITGFNSGNEGVSIPAISTSYDAIADFIMQLKTMDCISDAYVASIAESEDEETGEVTYSFTVTASYVMPVTDTATEETAE